MLKNFIKRLSLFSLLIAIISFILYTYIIPHLYIPIYPILFAFFVISTLSVHALLTKAGKLKINKFSTYYMGSISAKLFLYLIFIIIYVVVDKKTAVPFLITFLILYFLFTFFETISLLNDIKKQSTPTN
jgi:hypothetical protein